MDAPAGSPDVPLAQLAGVFFRIGLFSFGGGLTGWIHRDVVQRRGWMDDESFLSGVALAQVLPGANVTNLAVFVGNRLRGYTGAVVALTAMLAAPTFICVLALLSYESISAVPMLHAAVDGVAAAAVGLNLRLAIVGANRVLPRIAPTAAMIATFFAIGVMQWPLVASILVIAPISVALSWPRGDAHA